MDTLHVNEDEDLVIDSVSVVDVDMTLDVKLKVTWGTIQIATIAGLWIKQNRDSTSEWKGTVEHTNAALSSIIYRGKPDFHGDDVRIIRFRRRL